MNPHAKTHFRGYAIVAWLSLIGAILPAKQLSIQAGVTFTPARISIIVLFFPAVFGLLAKGYRLLWVDFFAFATAAWIVMAGVSVNGLDALFSRASGESLEFLGSYLVGRAFLWRPEALQTFIGVLMKVIAVLFLLALADRISGRWILQDTIASIVNVAPPSAGYRNGVVRAIATFDHPILLGAFFALASALIISSGRSGFVRSLYAAICLAGCILALSSSAIMSWIMIIGAYFYDKLFERFPWRWGLFWGTAVALLSVIFAVTNAPLGWLITHLTLDPESGYFRYLIWNEALALIPLAPFTGVASHSLDSEILNTTVDSVWLVYALQFGLPTIAFLFLANLAAIWPSKISKENSMRSDFADQMNTAFSIVLLVFMFIGLTVHYWNFMWIFWALCLGIKASLKQHLAR